ncbi:4Fe-4S dicluster domain-containing protein [Saccharicrinis carchari]|uniref:4Fe-4S dicluster domain-containing protein n=1 Tax=Saccharicrinis carchari TaxID=1168039 RepID=A0A521BV76_SACCC|nr:4Fe-4S dicluster domain-containing protein [Saccharicrinis carchari]SMO51069.1 4Fe-4S dicluster domain-containing protein [Saccharicrinis carchari]
MEPIIFAIALIITLGLFIRSIWVLKSKMAHTRPAPFDGKVKERLALTARVAFGQSKILRKPAIGLIHALVFWGFLVITIGSLEMVVDGLTGWHRSFSGLGGLYDVISASGDLFAIIVLTGVVAFLFRRLAMHIKRFKGIEITPKNKLDANIALLFILLLMVSLIGMNVFDILTHPRGLAGFYPVSSIIAQSIDWGPNHAAFFRMFWWMHIILIFVFANYLPYSKHFHVFMSVPNVFFSNLKPLTYLPSMPEVTREVKLMLNGEAFSSEAEPAPSRFGVKDVEDITWKNYLDSLTCTQCGRCTEVCPANITGKLLSPRKLFVDLRNRMDEKKPLGGEDGRSLIGHYITPEELWACTSCNACALECPLNISHPNLIMDMRRYLVLEEGNAPEGLNIMFANIENNGAPWKFSAEDRLQWTEEGS